MLLIEGIRTIERRHALISHEAATSIDRGTDQAGCLPTGWPDVDQALGGELLVAALHEWFGVCHSERQRRIRQGEKHRSARCFPGAPGLSMTGSGWTAPVCILVHLAWQALVAGPFSRWIVWVGKGCFPYPSALIRENGHDHRLLERSIFVSAGDASSRLWAIDLALRSSVVGAVIADGSAFNMAATRRIQLVAKRSRVMAFLARPPWELNELSAAQTRWSVRYEPVTHGDATTFVKPRWSVELLRCKGVQPDTTHRAWALEWDRATSTVGLSAPLARQAGDAKTATNGDSGKAYGQTA